MLHTRFLNNDGSYDTDSSIVENISFRSFDRLHYFGSAGSCSSRNWAWKNVSEGVISKGVIVCQQQGIGYAIFANNFRHSRENILSNIYLRDMLAGEEEQRKRQRRECLFVYSTPGQADTILHNSAALHASKLYTNFTAGVECFATLGFFLFPLYHS